MPRIGALFPTFPWLIPAGIRSNAFFHRMRKLRIGRAFSRIPTRGAMEPEASKCAAAITPARPPPRHPRRVAGHGEGGVCVRRNLTASDSHMAADLPGRLTTLPLGAVPFPAGFPRFFHPSSHGLACRCSRPRLLPGPRRGLLLGRLVESSCLLSWLVAAAN